MRRNVQQTQETSLLLSCTIVGSPWHCGDAGMKYVHFLYEYVDFYFYSLLIKHINQLPY